MENQRLAKRRRKEAAGTMKEDRLSQLPQHILHHHILSLLPQHDAVRTCMLSKSWRHLGSSRPKFEFHEISFRGKKHDFLSVVENTLQRYDDQKLPIHEFILRMFLSDPLNNSIIKKWVVKLHMLKRLNLHLVHMEEETFEKIVLSCPLIEHLVLDFCTGLSNIKVNTARNLKHLSFTYINRVNNSFGSIEIMNDAPYLETMSISTISCRNWYNLHKNYFFPRLKSLCLTRVHLPTELLNNLSSKYCPCLEELELRYCSGFTEFKLSNRSIKRLIIIAHGCPIKSAIDAANILYFEYSGNFLPSISFATTSNEWESHIDLWPSESDVFSTWSFKMHEFLEALCKSQISLSIPPHLLLMNQETYDGGSCEPVVVEHLCLREYHSPSAVPDLLNCLFRICRPKYIGLPFYKIDSPEIFVRRLAESMWKTLVNKGEPKECDFWQQDLEGSSILVSDISANEWRPVQICEWEFSNNEKIRFRLKWRDIS